MSSGHIKGINSKYHVFCCTTPLMLNLYVNLRLWMRQQLKPILPILLPLTVSPIWPPTKSFMLWFNLSQYLAYFLFVVSIFSPFLHLTLSPNWMKYTGLFFSFLIRTALDDLDVAIFQTLSCACVWDREGESRKREFWKLKSNNKYVNALPSLAGFPQRYAGCHPAVLPFQNSYDTACVASMCL